MSLDSIASLNDARALLDTFTSEGWQTALIRVGGNEFSLSRDAVLDRPASVASELPGTAAAQAPTTMHQAKAPHVATVVEIAAVGTNVTKGGHLAVLSVLGEAIKVLAPVDGQVCSHGAKSGDLVEFGQVLVEIAAQA